MLIKRWLGSLANRAVALVVVAIILTALLVTVAGFLLSRSELEQQARNQVETIATLIAGELDDKLALRLEALNHVAQNLTMSSDVLDARARVLIRRQTALEHLFDAVYLMDEKGLVIAEHPEDYRQAGLNVSDREYFRRISSTLTPVISEPYISNYQEKPAIMVAAPIFDHRQRFIGVLGGAIALDGNNFLDQFINIRIGTTGYLGVATRSGFVVVSQRDDEAMAPVRVANPVLRDAMEGFEGTLETNSGEGERTIMSVQQLTQVPWFVSASWPAREALAPITRTVDAFLWILLVVILLIAPIALWRFRRLMAPLKTLGSQIRERHLGMRSDPVDVAGGKEIRQVAEIFNTVTDERDEVLVSLAEREAFFRSLTQSAPIGIVQTDVLGRIEFANPAFEAIVGRPAEELTYSYLANRVHNTDRQEAIAGWKNAIRNQSVFRGRLRLESPAPDQVIWGDVMTAAIQTPEKALGTITVVRDISHELEVEEALRTEQQRAETILRVLQEGVLMVDVEGVIRFANDAACRLLGTEGECLLRNFFQLVTIETEERELTAQEFLSGEDLDSLYVTLRNSLGVPFPIDLTMLHIRQGREDERLVFVLRDDSDRRRQEERLSWEATHDSLTQLLNRRAFNASLVRCLGEADRQDVRSVLMLIDLDYFKPVNDEGGHLLGDDLLKRLADLFKDSVRQSDTVARLGGDEFGIILPACGMARAQALAERIRADVEALRLEHDGRSFGVTTSIGLTELTPEDSGPREVMARADEGSYIAKSRGRNRVVVVPSPPAG
ncbi:diguanylate cyclase [Marinobacter sp. EhC06]|jgi:diguanylate cyclase (GGDEF)-like protein/PAS domain S-box-containing protein|uniref:sensor domain-containing diguanylate cyclase n=2 Tax=Marinobacteraceae TaxID=2887365 RepID=UPI0007D8E74D|nr:MULTISPECIES: diguanylate cyclase [unclassified Marinobacter]OAN88244.1 diguanylate cyclase [Marinobacter sp. EhN04]OAN91227.1 diguanylate cyclase [Marinobacter sp. EhC06]